MDFLRVLRRGLLGSDRALARQAQARRVTPSLALLRRFEAEFGVRPGADAVVFGRLTDPRARRRVVGISRSRLREFHLVACGATGCGKTTLGMGLTRDVMTSDGTRLVNLDPKGDTSRSVEGLVHELAERTGDTSFLERVKFIRPFDPHVVPQLRLTARERGVAVEVQALSLASGLEEATGGESGSRMRSILTPLAALVIELELPLSVLTRWLAYPRAFADAASGSRNERIREYARTQFPRESRESISALRSRLEAVLLLPVVRRALEARTILPLGEWLERYDLCFDWSRPPAGQEAAVRALCGPLLGRLTRLLLNREPGPQAAHIWLLADEVQEVLSRFETASFGRLLALARSRGVSCVFLHQQRSQLPRELQELLKTNGAVEMVFRANRRDALGYANALPVPEGDPDAARLRASLVRKLERLPRREFFLLVKDSPVGGQFLRAPDIRIGPACGTWPRIASCGDPADAHLGDAEDPIVHPVSDVTPCPSTPPVGTPGADVFPSLG